MKDRKDISLEEKLAKLRDEREISDAAYDQLRAAMRKSATEAPSPSSSEREFEAFRKRLLTGGMIICIIGLPVGIVMGLPYVWGLSIVGIIVGGTSLRRIKSSWFARIVDKRFPHRPER